MIGEVSATPAQGILFGMAALPICLWVAYTDLSEMRIRNEAVLALAGVFVLGGLATFTAVDAYLWRFAHLGVVLAAGIVLTAIGVMGAGDAKLAAVIALFVAPGDVGTILVLFALVLATSFALHRAARAMTPVREMVPGWRSWRERGHFPAGVALAGTLVAYLALAAAA